MRSLTSALTTIRRSPYQALVSISMMTVTFFVAFSFSLAVLGANHVLRYFETQPQIIAFFEIDAGQESISQAAEAMKKKPYVKDVTIVSKEEALKIYQESNKDEPLLLELVTADILPASIEVSATDINSLPQVKSDLESLSGVEDVDFQESIIEQLNRWTRSLRSVGLGAVVILAVISFLIIFVIIAMKATSQKTAINIMRLIGATKGYIKKPFMYEGMIYGMTGALVGWVSMYAVLLYLTPWIQDFLGEVQLLPVSIEILLTQLAIGVGAGMLLGGMAGLLAVGRLIRR